MAHDQRNDEEQATRRRANLLQVRYFDTRTLEKIPTFENELTNEEMYRHQAVLLSKEEGRVIIAITNGTPQQSLKELRRRFNDFRLNFVMVSDSGFRDFMRVYDPPKKYTYEDISIKPDQALDSLEFVSKTIESVRPEDVFNYLIRQASALQASDIHLESQEDNIQIRFRVDGVLHKIADITVDKYRQLNSTIAIHANISSNSPVAQTGHMNHKITDDDGKVVKDLNMRIETVPTLHGQDAVIRLFTFDTDLLNLDNLGLSERQRGIIDGIIEHPTGLVLAVGPTGSGKTTTLYSILQQLNSPERKIITLEDPVEYNLPGVTQIPVNTGDEDSFADKLRAVLRLDPDIIMVGEIRDADTARTAMQASLSGHLVLSTFHANDTTTALSRLKEFIGDNPLFTSSIRLLIAQRLVRRLDDSTKKPTEVSSDLLKQVAGDLEALPESVDKPQLDGATFYEAVKTDDSPFGYTGQIAIVELLEMTPELEKLARSSSEVTGRELREIAVANGMIGMLQDGLIKATQGITTIDEVYRVVA